MGPRPMHAKHRFCHKKQKPRKGKLESTADNVLHEVFVDFTVGGHDFIVTCHNYSYVFTFNLVFFLRKIVNFFFWEKM